MEVSPPISYHLRFSISPRQERTQPKGEVPHPYTFFVIIVLLVLVITAGIASNHRIMEIILLQVHNWLLLYDFAQKKGLSSSSTSSIIERRLSSLQTDFESSFLLLYDCDFHLFPLVPSLKGNFHPFRQGFGSNFPFIRPKFFSHYIFERIGLPIVGSKTNAMHPS